MQPEPPGEVLRAHLGAIRLEDLHSFLVLCEELHFTRAADRLFLTTGGLSRRVARLESSLCQTLFERSTREVSLTSAGHRVAGVARGLLAQAHALA